MWLQKKESLMKRFGIFKTRPHGPLEWIAWADEIAGREKTVENGPGDSGSGYLVRDFVLRRTVASTGDRPN